MTNWLQHDVYPKIGKMPISEVGPRDVLAAVQVMENRGAIDSAHRVKQICGQIFRFAVAAGSTERDVTADLRGALSAIPKSNYAAITEPAHAAALLHRSAAKAGYPGPHGAPVRRRPPGNEGALVGGVKPAVASALGAAGKASNTHSLTQFRAPN